MDFTEFIDVISRIVVQGMLNAVWQGIFIIAMLSGIVVLFRRISASTRYILWFGGFVVITLLPFLNIVTNKDIQRLPDLFYSRSVTVEEFQYTFQPGPQEILSTNDVSNNNSEIKSEIDESIIDSSPTVSSEPSNRNIWQNLQFKITSVYAHVIIFCLWLIVSILLLVRLIRRIRNFLRSKQNTVPVSLAIQDRFNSILKSYRVGRKVLLKSSSSISVPQVSGIVRPEIMLPESMLTRFDSHELDQVLLHELAHIVRRDDWANLFQKFVESVLFFLPAVWILKQKIHNTREESCDEFVLLHSGGKKEYASCLVKVAERLSFTKKPYLEFAMASSKNNLFKRVEAILNFDPGKHKKTMSAGIAIASIVILFVVYQILIRTPLLSLQEDTTVAMTDVLTHEFSFGDKDLPDEYLLAKPIEIVVAENGDIIIGDESRLKIFDNNGNPKQLVGGQGQGPGEFDGYVRQFITETGYIAAVRDRAYQAYNIFAPDYSFIETINLQFNGIRDELKEMTGWSFASMGVFTKMYAFSTEEYLLQAYSRELQDGKLINTIQSIVEVKSDVPSIIFSAITPAGIGVNQIVRGYLHYSLLPDRKVAYSNPPEHKFNENGSWYYSLFIHDLLSGEKTEVQKKYTPAAIPDSVIYRDADYPDGAPEEIVNRVLDQEKERIRALEELAVYPAVYNIMSDNETVFVFTFEYDKEKGRLVDIFDGIKGEYIRSAYFPAWVANPTARDRSFLRNGYVYRLITPLNDFAVVEKYKIDPKVYGK